MLTDRGPRPFRLLPPYDRRRTARFNLNMDTELSSYHPLPSYRYPLLRFDLPRLQTGRHRPPNAPYAKPTRDRDEGPSRRGPPIPNGVVPIAARMTRTKMPINHARRDPIGTPTALRPPRSETAKAAHSKLNEKLGSEEMKAWLRSRILQEGVMNMSVGCE